MFPDQEKPGEILQASPQKKSSQGKVQLARNLTNAVKAAPPMTTRVQTNTQFFAPVLHDMGNTSLFDEEDEMNMSMESGVQSRLNNGLPPESPIRVTSPGKTGAINGGLTEAVMEVDEENEPQN